ncbi:MAG: gamma-glutamylcyclotransferase family protein [Polaromonas sp.]
MSPAPVRHVFVYGTLRRGQERDINRLRPAPRWLGRASVRGLMYQLGNYPGVVLGASGLVQGEVYAISAELELQLDVIEAVGPAPGDEYIKRETAVRIEHEGELFEEVVCLVYELAPGRSSGKAEISSGDWADYLAANAG